MKIKELIIKEINKKGSISVEEFIQICQFENNGYYINQNPIGKNKDFITAPEISQMFGEILAVFIINFWEKKIKTNFNLIELGPGKGTLLNDVLRIASKNQKFLNASYITLIEKNKSLMRIQKNKIIFKSIRWTKEFDIKNQNIPSIVYSNEFFDCFPVRQFNKKGNWYEKFITYNYTEKKFSFILKKVKNDKLLNSLKKFNNVKVAEISEKRVKYFNSVCKFIKKNRGLFVTIDYGYKNPPSHLSLQTIYNHKKTHLFENIGKQDITSHVNFDELIHIAHKHDLKIDIFCTQKDFLITCGIQERKNYLEKNKNELIAKNLESGYQRLIDKSQMGEIFKVLVVSCL